MAAFVAVMESFALVLALSVDAFVASFAYGTSKIRIPLASVLVISAVCSGILALSLALGYAVRELIPPRLIRLICFALLLIPGAIKLFDSALKSSIRRRAGQCEIAFEAMDLHFILQVYADPDKADRDQSRVLSCREALSLAAALSLDGLAAGVGAAIGSISIPLAVVISLLCSVLLVCLGSKLGNRMAKRAPMNLSWISGALLILLAISKLIP